MKFKKLVSAVSALTVAAGCIAGMTITASAAYESKYERGTTTAWSDADLTEWVGNWATPTIDGGLTAKTKNAGYTITKDISGIINSQDKVKFTITWAAGGPTGRSGAYDYLALGEDVQIRSYGQDWKSAYAINGVETDLRIDGRNHVFTISAEIDTATKTLTSLIVDGTERITTPEVLQNGTVNNFILGHYKNGSEKFEIINKITKLEISTEAQSVQTYNYAINYKLGDTVVKSTTGSNIDGFEVTGESFVFDEEGNKYYTSDGTIPTLTISASGSNILDVPVREAYDFNYSVVSSIGTEIASGTQVEGENITVPFPRYILKDGKLYVKDVQTYSETFAVTEDNLVRTIDYAETDIKNVVYYSEAEDVAGLTETTRGNIPARSSNCKAAYAAEDTVLVNLQPGKYTVEGVVYSNSTAGATVSFGVGDTNFDWTVTGASNWSSQKKEIEVTEPTDFIFKASGNDSEALDFIYIVKTGDIVVAPTASASLVQNYTTETATDNVASLWKMTVTPGSEAITSVGVKATVNNEEKAGTVVNTGTTVWGNGQALFAVVINKASEDIQSIKAVINGDDYAAYTQVVE